MLPGTTILVISSVVILLVTFVYYLKNREFYKLASHIPGPLPLPIIGSAHLFLGNSEKIYTALLELYKKFPTALRFWLGNELLVAFYKPGEIKTILCSQATYEKSYTYNVMKPWLGSGLITAKVDTWRVHRKLIQPSFNQRVLVSFIDIFHRHTVMLTKKLEQEIDGKEFDVSRYLSICSLGIIHESAMGVDDSKDENVSKKYLHALEKILETMILQVFKIWLQVNFIFKLTKLAKPFEEYIKYLHKSTDDIIRSKRKMLEIKEFQEVSDDSPQKMKPFLELLMTISDQEKTFTDLELRNEVDTFLFAGHDTTASTLSYALLILASYPDIQAKLYKEIYEVFGTKSPEEVPCQAEHLGRLVYLEKVIKETMRFFPIVPVILRKTTQNLKIGEYMVPKGATLIVPVSKLHRDERIWDDPLTFNPDRFSQEEVAKRPAFSFIPFSAGPRNCIGQVFAMMSMKSTMSTILRKYIVKKKEITPLQDIRLKLDILLRPVEPITISIEKRIVN